MNFELNTGLKFTIEQIVSKDDTAAKYGSGLVEVFATPAMIALMEKTSLNVVLEHLPEGFNTVGTAVNVTHLKATPVGDKVTCNAELIHIDRKALEFKVEAFDSKGLIGEGTHKRFIIETEKFMNKLNA